VLDQLPLVSVNSGEDQKYNALKGSALFYRAFAFEGLAQLFCKPYSTTNANELGIVLRLTSNVNAKSTRATVQQTYDQIIADLKQATDLLPAT
ncbi:RagB/SusD family nutrient uptake outer membrane protein, partial [Acinetobacter baumannii]|uniref:RagB/SusD family nutrient uptake outer membrane protein n=1 Tax=Acinetobacter baumannii TaxID=470 RepID=UPI00399388FF